jgi:hypothetical protein
MIYSVIENSEPDGEQQNSALPLTLRKLSGEPDDVPDGQTVIHQDLTSRFVVARLRVNAAGFT